MSREPTDTEYERYFELYHIANDIGDPLTDAEEQELERLGALVVPWLYTMDFSELALESHGLIKVTLTCDEGLKHTYWISDRFAVVPEHKKREIDGLAHFSWAIIPFERQPVYACSMFFEDGKFRRDEPELMKWPFHRWIYESIQVRRAYKQHFGSEFPDNSYSSCEGKIEKWIQQLNI